MKNPKDLEEAFLTIAKEMEQVFVKKHKDYGKGNILDTGELGIAFRISDKLNRLKNLLAQNKYPDNESIDDSWTDISVYAIIAIMYRRKWFQRLSLRDKKQVKKTNKID